MIVIEKDFYCKFVCKEKRKRKKNLNVYKQRIGLIYLQYIYIVEYYSYKIELGSFLW